MNIFNMKCIGHIMEPKDNGSSLDFSFAFKDINFSDRVLRIEIEQGDKTEFRSTSISFADRILRRKVKRKEKKDYGLLCNIEVKSIHISSPILAAKSPFFLKLFSNGMKESKERIATLRIHSSEEVALMDLLNFMYNNTLKSKTTTSLVDVLMVADKFQVSSCIRYCSNLLCNLPMTCELALQYLRIPSTVSIPDEVQPLVDAANKYLAHCYQNFTRFEKEVIKLPLAEIEAMLSSDNRQTNLTSDFEDVVYEFVLKWARKHYPMIEKRREILTTRLSSLIRFEKMTCGKLKEVSSCNDFDPAYASKVVLEALLFKAESTHLHTSHRPPKVYARRPVKVLESMFPHPHCIVYLDLRKKDCDNLSLSDHVYFNSFSLGKKWFYLFAQRMQSDTFGLFLGLCAKQSGSCSVAYEFSARSKPTDEFVSKRKLTYTLGPGGHAHGNPNIFGVSWSQFIAPDSIYFIKGVLYLKVDIAMKS